MNKVKFIAIAFCASLTFNLANAQDSDTTYWTKGGFATVTFSQVSLTNWAAGGENSISINAQTGLFADYAKDRTTWENSLDLGYGLVKQGDADFVKADDKINLVSKFGYKFKKDISRWYFSGLLDFRTQFDEGFSNEMPDSLISKFMAPAYLTVGLGIDYKPNPKLSINYIPLTGKFTFVNVQELADLGAYGVEPGNKARAELGSFLRIKYKDEVLKNVNLDTRLELFSNYVKDFGVIDVNWQTSVVMKINDVLSANLFTHLLYDKDIKMDVDTNDDGINDAKEARVQFKNVFGVGLGYTFGATRAK